ncbi:MAG TPA: helix-turn-helix transcriptional regulator, partial [Polyangiaceae bacterium]|nr:helix-turn-helix transcriptional regulator [Polyangiaceae bacterium]
QEELCERAEISVDAVNRIENGTRVPTIDTLEKIAAGLGVSLTDLLQMPSAKPSRVAAPVRRVLSLIENESADVQQGVEEIVRVALKLAKPKRSKRR